MPSTSYIFLSQIDNVAYLTHTTNDPRRKGRVDLAIFPSMFLPIVMPYYEANTVHFNKEFYLNKVSLTSFFSNIYTDLYKVSTRIEQNCDYFPRNYQPRPVSDHSHLAPRYGQRLTPIEYFKPIKYKSKSECTVLTIRCQAKLDVKIKVNTFLVQYIPTRMFFPRGKNGLYFLPKNDDGTPTDNNEYYNDRHGRSLAIHLLEKSGSPLLSLHHCVRSDILDYRIDTMSWTYTTASIIVTNHYRLQTVDGVECGVLTITSPDYKQEYIFDKVYLEDVKDFHWTINKNKDEVYASDDESRMLLKRYLVGLTGANIGQQFVSSRMTFAYKRAVDKDDYSKRAKFENTEFSDTEISGKGRRFTKPVFVHYRVVKAEQITDGMNDYRVQFLRVKTLSKK